MSKRSATTELNHDNWNVADEKEDPGNFKPLSGAQLQNRVIRKAKRSLNCSATGSPTASSPFAKFSGFTSSTNSSSLFGALNKTSSPFSVSTPKSETPTQSPFHISQDKTNSTSSSSIFTPSSKRIKEEFPNGKTEESKITEEPKKPTAESSQAKQSRGVEYCRQLKCLNESVMKWMQLHLAKNSISDFTPVFDDYKKHLNSLNMKYPQRQNEAALTQQSADASKTSSVADNHSSTPVQHKFKVEKKESDETDYGAHFSSNTTNTSTFSFGIKATPTATSSNTPSGPNSSSKEEANQNKSEETNKTTSFFGQNNNNNKEESKAVSGFSAGFFGQNNNKEEGKAATGFSAGFFSKGFSSDKPFTFATAPVEKTAEAGEEEYVPPKNDFVAVSEEDAVYSKRCKLFFKKDEAFADKGVGTLYIKTIENSTQLLVRADTNLGNILLNIRLSASLPMSRSGKNNVLIACVPNPPVDPKHPDTAIPILIRVKTSEDADELLENLNKYKS